MPLNKLSVPSAPHQPYAQPKLPSSLYPSTDVREKTNMQKISQNKPVLECSCQHTDSSNQGQIVIRDCV